MPGEIKTRIGFYVTPVLGLAILVFAASLYGHLWPFTFPRTAMLIVGLCGVSLLFEKNRRELFSDVASSCAFAVFVSFAVLAPAFRFDAFNPFNDTFTYLVHSQWLQQHSYSELARVTGFFPAETQVALYQAAGNRMGASFFLALVQSLFKLDWSYNAYLPTAAFVFVAGSLAMGGIVRQIVPLSRRGCLLLCTLPAISMNGFVFGAQYGFLPQTFGLAFAAGVTATLPPVLRRMLRVAPGWRACAVLALPLALCAALVMLSYTDMFMALAAGIAFFLLLVCCMDRERIRPVLRLVLVLFVEVGLILNVELVGLVRNFVHIALNAAAGNLQFGWPMPWAPVQFLAYSFGLKSHFNGDVLVLDKTISVFVFPVVLAVIAALAVSLLRSRSRRLPVLLLLCINAVFAVAFLKFRYFSPNVVDGYVGQTFLQFKLSNWLAPYNLALFGASLGLLYLAARKYRRAMLVFFCAVLCAGMFIHYRIVAQMLTTQFQDETALNRSGFNLFLDLRSRVQAIPKDSVMYLGIPFVHHKLTQMVLYVLHDRKLIGDYQDGYLQGTIPPAERNLPVDMAEWIIFYQPIPTPNEDPLARIGPLLIRRAPFSFYAVKNVEGAYGTEFSGMNSWNWVKDSVRYELQRVGSVGVARLSFKYLVAGHERTLNVAVATAEGKKLASYTVAMPPGWGEFTGPEFKTDQKDLVVSMTASGDPTRLSNNDPRETKFLIQNFALESVRSEP
jgi:hypothetical protein